MKMEMREGKKTSYKSLTSCGLFSFEIDSIGICENNNNNEKVIAKWIGRSA